MFLFIYSNVNRPSRDFLNIFIRYAFAALLNITQLSDAACFQTRMKSWSRVRLLLGSNSGPLGTDGLLFNPFDEHNIIQVYSSNLHGNHSYLNVMSHLQYTVDKTSVGLRSPKPEYENISCERRQLSQL